MAEKHKCPVCGKFDFEEHNSLELCEECGWQDDALYTNDPDYKGGPNEMSLNEARVAYENGEPVR